MNLEKVIFGFFILLAFTLNFGFVIGEIDVAHKHDVTELFAAIVVNLIATVIKLGDRTQVGALHLATSLVADLQLIAASLVYHLFRHDSHHHHHGGFAFSGGTCCQFSFGDFTHWRNTATSPLRVYPCTIFSF